MDQRVRGANEDFDHEIGRDIGPNHPGFASFAEELSKMTPDQRASADLHHREKFRRFAGDIAEERRLEFFGMFAERGEQVMESGGIVGGRFRGDLAQVRLRGFQLMIDDGAQEGGFAGEVGIERFFAHG